MFVIYFSVLLSICGWTTVAGIQCLSCSRATSMQQCFVRTVHCKDSEKCFLDKTIRADLTHVFTAGCRSTLICDLIGSATGRKRHDEIELTRGKKDNVVCAQCCTFNSAIPCNAYLCNHSPSQTTQPTQPSHHITKCAVCSGRVSEPTDCHNTTQCPPDQVCGQRMVFVNGKLVYEVGCEKKTVCDHNLKALGNLGSSVGKRASGETVVCNGCCEGINCNKGYCQQIRKIINRGDEICFPVVGCTGVPGENHQTCHKLLTNFNHLMRILNSQLEL